MNANCGVLYSTQYDVVTVVETDIGQIWQGKERDADREKISVNEKYSYRKNFLSWDYHNEFSYVVTRKCQLIFTVDLGVWRKTQGANAG